MDLNASYWDNRYKEGNIGWDLGKISNPLQTYFDQLTHKDIRILIPGAGNSYEAEYLFKKGFINTYVVDVSKTALNNLKERVPNFPDHQLIHGNFFELKTTFDLIIEQTFFCAINPSLRGSYGMQTSNLLSKKGKLVGVLFNNISLNEGPPFGGNKKEYLDYFSPFFNVKAMELCHNSEQNRSGKELFINMIKK